jgi:hypothetical protein
VPVTPLGTRVTGVDTPGAKPFVPTGALGSAPSEEVTPSGGIVVPTWANAGLKYSMVPTVAAINNGRMKHLRSEREDCEASGRITAGGRQWKRWAQFFMAVDRGWIVSAAAPRATFR